MTNTCEKSLTGRLYDIQGVCRYKVTSDGHVYDTVRRCLVAECDVKSGYRIVHLRIKGKSATFSLHRIVGMAAVEGYSEGLDINHKDGNKKNNHPSNLEWVTRSENIKHAYKTNLRKSSRGIPKDKLGKSVVQISLSGEIIATFISISEAKRETGVKNIDKVISGKRDLAGGYRWAYKESVVYG